MDDLLAFYVLFCSNPYVIKAETKVRIKASSL